MFCKGLSSYEAYQKFPAVVNRIQALQDEISGGTTAVLALIFQKKLFVANVGDSRALLCRETVEGSVSVEQVSIIFLVYIFLVSHSPVYVVNSFGLCLIYFLLSTFIVVIYFIILIVIF